MELSRGEILYNQVAEKYNDLLARFQALRRENDMLQHELDQTRAEATEWKRKFLASQKEEKQNE